MSATTEGTVIAAHGRHYEVEADDGHRWQAMPRGKKSLCACGDRVRIEPAGSDQARILDHLKKRLYDFPQKRQWIKEWEQSSIREHQEIVDFLAAGDPQSAALFLRDVHWSYAVQEKYIRRYYGDS